MTTRSAVSIKNLFALKELDAGKPVRRISLQQAARDGKEFIVREWLDNTPQGMKGAIINVKDPHGYAALHYAARFNRFKIMQLLVTARGIDPNVRSNDGLTPLHFAAKYLPPYLLNASAELDFVAEGEAEVTNLSSSLRAIQLLITYSKCNINPKAKQSKKTPLHLACSHGNAAAVDALIEVRGIELNAVDSNLQTPLHNACLFGDKWIVERLLKTKKVDLFAENDDGMTPLHVACLEGQTEIVKLILLYAEGDRGKLVSLTDTKKSSTLHLACESGIPEIVQALLLHKADTSAVDLNEVSPMHIAAKQGFVRIADIMLEVSGENISVLDHKQFTPLHYAAKFNQADMVDFLVQKGAEVDAVDENSQTPLLIAAQYGQEKAFKRLMENGAVLDFVDKNRRSCVFLAAEHDSVGILKLLVANEKGRKLCCGTDSELNTPLHIAAKRGNASALNILLSMRGYVRIHARNDANKTALHLAAEVGNSHVCQALYKFDQKKRSQDQVDFHEENTIIINDGDEDLNTPLQLACARGRRTTVKYLLRVYSDPSTRNSKLRTPAHSAAYGGWEEVLELLVDFEADLDSEDKNGVTPLQLACTKGHLKCAEVLMKNGAKVTTRPGRLNCLELAIIKGHQDVAQYIIESDQWIDALRNCADGQETPMRRLIKNMPDVAEAVFNRCTAATSEPDVLETDEGLEVTYIFEFIEDFQRIHQHPSLHRSKTSSLVYTLDTPSPEDSQSQDEEENETGCCGKKTATKRHWATDWGPKRFTKSNHPLAIMVKHERTNLLKHPLVTTLLDYKWRKYTQLVFAVNFLLYFFFVLLLTAFALVVSTPLDRPCMEVQMQQPSAMYDLSNISTICESGFNRTDNCSSTDYICSCASCDQVVYWPWEFTKPSQSLDSRARYWFLFIAAIILTLLALLRLVMEFYQLCLRRLDYVTDWINWLEDILFATAVIFVWIFHNDCYCSRGWQWQVGVFAVFLSWINLVLFIQKLPRTGIYVVMFLNIFYTFLKVVMLSILLVISFGLAFYMVFYKPQIAGIMISAFENPARSMFKTITMTTGELDFDSLFQHGSPIGDQLPYLAASIIIWIIFIILMPILLTNLLVGLAVDDIQAIQESATLKRLSLQVDLALSVEEKFNQLRWKYNVPKLRTHPNRNLNPVRKAFYAVWGGRDYGSIDMQEVLDPQRSQEPLEEIQGHSRSLVADMDNVKNKVKDSFKRIRDMEEKLNQIATKLQSGPDTAM